MTTLETRFGVNDILGGLNPEKNPGERKKIVVEGYDGRVVNGLRRAYERYVDRNLTDERVYEEIERLKPGAKDIEEFSLRLGEYRDNVRFSAWAGAFLSKCFNKCSDSAIVVHLSHLDKKLAHIGNALDREKKVVVFGYFGLTVGRGMAGTMDVHGDVVGSVGGRASGVLNIYGNVRGSAGEYQMGGELNVYGNVGWNAGTGMTGGLVNIQGDVVNDAGSMMRGGELNIHGAVGQDVGFDMINGVIKAKKFIAVRWSYGMIRGEIWENGRRIMKDGVRIE